MCEGDVVFNTAICKSGYCKYYLVLNIYGAVFACKAMAPGNSALELELEKSRNRTWLRCHPVHRSGHKRMAVFSLTGVEGDAAHGARNINYFQLQSYLQQATGLP